jgi:hypothetical protein
MVSPKITTRIALITVSMGFAAVSIAAPPITTGLFVNLNADSATNFTLGGANEVSLWKDLANNGTDGTIQDFGNNNAANQPLFTTMVMPNGQTMSVVDFTRGTVSATSANSSTTSSDFLVNQGGGLTGPFTPGPDTAYQLGGTPEADGFSYFVVWKTDIVTNPAPTSTTSTNRARQARQVVIQYLSSDTNVVTQWGINTTEDTTATVFGSSTVPNVWHNIRNESFSQNYTPEADVTANWYIMAMTANLDGGPSIFRTKQSDGTDSGNTPIGATTFTTPFGAHTETIIGQTTSALGSGQRAFDGQIAEVLLYNTTLSETDFNSIVDYLNNKYFVPPTLHDGDFDGDGDVDGADFVAWQTNFPKASGAVLSEGDADGDGDVDGADFVVWQTNFPFTPGPGASPVPEPAACWVAIAGAGFVVGRFQRGRRPR